MRLLLSPRRGSRRGTRCLLGQPGSSGASSPCGSFGGSASDTNRSPCTCAAGCILLRHTPRFHHLLSWGVSQILGEPLEELRVVSAIAEEPVARPAGQRPDTLPASGRIGATRVIVFDRQLLRDPGRPLAQGALAALCVVELPVLLVRNAEGPLDVLAMPGSPARPLDPKVVGLAAGTRELGVSSLLAGQLIAELGHAVLAHLSASHHTSFLNGC